MPRNLERRVATLVPILDASVHRQVLDQILVANLNDEAQSWDLSPDGSYRRRDGNLEGRSFSVHEYFMTHPSLSGRGRKVKDLPRAFEHVGSRR